MFAVYYSRHVHPPGDVYMTSGIPGVGSARMLPGIKILSISVTCAMFIAANGAPVSSDLMCWEAMMWDPGEKADIFVSDNTMSSSMIERGIFFRGHNNQTVQKRYYENKWTNIVNLRCRSYATDGYVVAANINADFWFEIEYTR